MLFRSVTFADGTGQIWEVPAPLVCGAEGLLGVILEMKARLKRQIASMSESEDLKKNYLDKQLKKLAKTIDDKIHKKMKIREFASLILLEAQEEIKAISQKLEINGADGTADLMIALFLHLKKDVLFENALKMLQIYCGKNPDFNSVSHAVLFYQSGYEGILSGKF